MSTRSLTFISVVLAVAAGILISTRAVRAQRRVDVPRALTAQSTDGAVPSAALIQATDGNFYGTTAQGGISHAGTLYRMTPSGSITVLHAFAGGAADGANPYAALIQATDGNFYGTTFAGGGTSGSGLGTAFQMTPGGTVTVLHAFTGGAADGAKPRAALIQATDGDFYGTTSEGGASNLGTVFKMTPSGAVTVLHAFAGGTTDGASPLAALLQANDGNLYGTTYGGGFDQGTVFKMTPSGTLTVLHAFSFRPALGPPDGTYPTAALIQGGDGNFYGTTSSGGYRGPQLYFTPGFGTVFKMTTDGTLTLLSTDGFQPESALIQASDGNFYGTTYYGCCGFEPPCVLVSIICLYRPPVPNPFGGRVFKMTAGGTVVFIRELAGGTTDGANPRAALIEGTDGNLYGTTAAGGARNAGTVFKMTFGGSRTTLHSFTGFLPKTATDMDGDLKSDLAVFRPSNGVWYIRSSSAGYNVAFARDLQWGLPGDVPIAGDFDRDGKTDLAVFRPSNGVWYIRDSSRGYDVATADAFQWGLPGDLPVAGDFDGDGKTELAVYRPTIGGWFIRYSSQAYSTASSDYFQWGLPGDLPVAGDFDGDGKTELAVYRPSVGGWFIRYSSLGYSATNSDYFQWGLPGDLPIAGDFDGDGQTDFAVYRPSIGGWFIRYSSRGYSTANSDYFQWGLPGDVPTAADFDGDSKTDLTVFRPSTGEWLIRYSSLGYSVGGSAVYQWGLPGDVLVK